MYAKVQSVLLHAVINYGSYISKDLLDVRFDRRTQNHSVYSYEYTMVIKRNKR